MNPPESPKAQTEKTTFRRSTTITAVIQAKPGVVWSILTNGDDMTRWNSTITSFEGQIALGQTIALKSILDEKRTFKLKVKVFEPETKLVWGDGQGKREYLLHDNNDGTTTFTMTETIGGLMFPLYAKYIPPFDESFEQYTRDLQEEAKRQAG